LSKVPHLMAPGYSQVWSFSLSSLPSRKTKFVHKKHDTARSARVSRPWSDDEEYLRVSHSSINRRGVVTVVIWARSSWRTNVRNAAGSLSAASRMTGAHLKTRRTVSTARTSS
jgi:hypothetical protein